MLTNNLQVSFTNFKLIVFIGCFLLILSPNVIFADDGDKAINKEDPIKENVLASANTKNTENIKHIEKCFLILI